MPVAATGRGERKVVRRQQDPADGGQGSEAEQRIEM